MSASRDKKKVKATESRGEIFIDSQMILKRSFEFDVFRPNWLGINNFIPSIKFTNCLMSGIPTAACLHAVAPKLIRLTIQDSKLSRITSNDLRGFDGLKTLNLDNNDIEELPGDLFVNTPNLEYISFAFNKIKVIGEKILDPLKILMMIDLQGNSGIDARFDRGFYSTAYLNDPYVTLAQLREKIKRCKPIKAIWEIVDEHKKEIEKQEKRITDQNAKIATLEKKLEEVNKSSAFAKFDFTIKVNGKEFKVQKEVLISNSPLLAQMIRDNQDVDTLELKDISEGTFEEILNFMHSKQPPQPTADFIELYAASGRLQMKELMDICAQKLMEKVTPENSFEVLSLCEKFSNIELQKKAHEEYKKKF